MRGERDLPLHYLPSPFTLLARGALMNAWGLAYLMTTMHGGDLWYIDAPFGRAESFITRTHTQAQRHKNTHTQINHKHTWRCVMHGFKGAHGHLTLTWPVVSCFGCRCCPTKCLGWRRLDMCVPKASGIKLKLKMNYVTATLSLYFKEPDEGYKLALVYSEC